MADTATSLYALDDTDPTDSIEDASDPTKDVRVSLRHLKDLIQSHLPLKVATGTITTGQLLALNATPQTVVAAPGANKAIVIELAEFWLDYNSAAYDGIAAGEDLTLKYTDGSGAVLATIETTGFLDQTSDQFRYVEPTTTAAFTPAINAAVVLHLLTAEIATGNSPLKYRITYRVIDCPFTV